VSDAIEYVNGETAAGESPHRDLDLLSDVRISVTEFIFSNFPFSRNEMLPYFSAEMRLPAQLPRDSSAIVALRRSESSSAVWRSVFTRT
jgi:hypothetical protein